jgi:general secretion pathway protein A
VSVVLLGQPPVHERIAAVRSFGQRVTVRYHLGVLSSSDTEAYIRFRLEAVGAQRDPFAPDAVRRIHEVTRGVPGTVSRLADVCLLLAYVEEADSIDVSIVERAAVDLA